jgi:hypothetical protein
LNLKNVDLQLPTKGNSLKKFDTAAIEELQNQFQGKPSTPVVEEKKKKWVPFGFSEVESAPSASSIEPPLPQTETLKQEPEIRSVAISEEITNSAKSCSTEPLVNVKVENVYGVEEEAVKPTKSSKKEKVVVFKKRKTENAQQNLRERLDE